MFSPWYNWKIAKLVQLFSSLNSVYSMLATKFINLYKITRIYVWFLKIIIRVFLCICSRKEIDGPLLKELVTVQNRAPEHFYKLVQTDFRLDVIDMLKFSKMLRGLNSWSIRTFLQTGSNLCQTWCLKIFQNVERS